MHSISISALAALLPALASAAPYNSVGALPTHFSAWALASGSPIHYAPIHARGGELYISVPTGACCGAKGLETCPADTKTLFSQPLGTTSLSLACHVPGGQSVYVKPTGEVSFTPPHGNAVPADCKGIGFKYTAAPILGPTNGYITWGDGFIACPGFTVDSYSNVWQVFARGNGVKPINNHSCILFTMAIGGDSDNNVWSYN